jgi:glycosyltransferase involved in cell wall biosynthesis
MIHNRYRIVGGEDVSTDAQVGLLRSAGHEVVLLEDSNERVDELGLLRTAASAIWSGTKRRAVGEVLAGSRFDVVHVQNFFPLFSPSVYYVAHDHEVPVVQSLRNFRMLCPEGMLHRNGEVCTDCVGKTVAWPGIRHRCYRNSARGSAVVAAMSTGHRWAGTWSRRVARYVAPSDYTRDVYTEAGWDPDKIEVIPNFVHPDPPVRSGSGGYALFVGRLARVKGVDTLLEAWTTGCADTPLHIVGDGPMRAEVEAAANSHSHISYLGTLSQSRLVEVLGDAEFVVVPTRGVESFGRVVVEAMATGTPAIVADHGGLRETTANSGAGLRFLPGDVAALVASVRKLRDGGDLRTMRIAARRHFEERFSGAVVLQRWVDLYREAKEGWR